MEDAPHHESVEKHKSSETPVHTQEWLLQIKEGKQQTAQICGEVGTLGRCQWDCKMVQLLRETVGGSSESET